MNILAILLLALIAPFSYFFDAAQRIYLPYLILAFVPVAIGAYYANDKKFNAKQIVDFCFPDEIWKHPSSRVDRWFFVVNTAFFTTLIVPFVTGSVVTSYWVTDLLASQLGSFDLATTSAWLIVIAGTILFMLVADFAIFFAHYLQHKIPFLWEFHKVHHSARVMTPITVYRMHPVDDLLTYSLAGVLTGFVLGGMHYLLGEAPQIYSVAGLTVVNFLFYVLFYNLRHSHFWLHYGKLGHIFISPAMHQIHHSEATKHWDKNMGFVFSLWDKLFGTLYVPERKEELRLGIGEESEAFNSVWALYWLPFRNNWHRICRWVTRGKSAKSGEGSDPVHQPE